MKDVKAKAESPIYADMVRLIQQFSVRSNSI